MIKKAHVNQEIKALKDAISNSDLTATQKIDVLLQGVIVAIKVAHSTRTNTVKMMDKLGVEKVENRRVVTDEAPKEQ